MPAPTLKVKAVPGRLFPDLRNTSRKRLAFVGWRECRRGSDGLYGEPAEHVIGAAPGIRLEGGKYHSETADLFVQGHEVHMTFNEPDGKTPIVVEVPDDSYHRTALREGDLAPA
jgi:hypothetical protein